MGDGTTSVVILAAELLKRACELIKTKIHPTLIMAGYRQALKEGLRYIQSNLIVKNDSLGDDILLQAARTSMSSKLIGPESQFFAEMVVTAMKRVESVDASGKKKYPVKAVRIQQCHGQSSRDTIHVNGYALQMARASQAMPRRVEKPAIALIDFNLNKFRLGMGILVKVDDPTNLEKIRQREMDVTRERCQKIIDSGARVVLTSKGIDDFAQKYFVEHGIMAMRRVEKDDLRRIARASGGSVVLSMAEEGGDESFDPASLGHAECVYEERVGDNEFVFLQGLAKTKAQTILLRGANEFMTAEIERSLHDSLCVVKRILESNAVVAGGGAVEAALSIYLEDYARTLGSREQLAIAEFAEALLVIPKTLALNAAKDATDLVAKMRVFHHAVQQMDDQSKKDLKYSGLDLINGKVRNNLVAGVLEPAVSKLKSLKFATEAAITILRIDDMIKLHPKKQKDPRHP